MSGWRVFNGIDEAGLWEVWLATVVSFGLGTDVGHVIEVRGWGAGLKARGAVHGVSSHLDASAGSATRSGRGLGACPRGEVLHYNMA